MKNENNFLSTLTFRCALDTCPDALRAGYLETRLNCHSWLLHMNIYSRLKDSEVLSLTGPASCRAQDSCAERSRSLARTKPVSSRRPS